MAASKEKYCNYIVFDVETGGLKPEEAPMTQIALILLNGKTLDEITRYTTFIKPYGQELGLTYQKAALDYTGITMAQIEGGKAIKEVIKDLIEIITQARSHNTHIAYKPILVGHNVKFDKGFLKYAFQYVKEDIAKYVEFEDHFCTMRLSQAKSAPEGPDLQYKLEQCCERANVELLDGHDAMNDTIATKELFVTHIRSLRESTGLAVQGEEGTKFRHSFKFEI